MAKLRRQVPPLTVSTCRDLFLLTLEAEGRSPATRRVYDAALRRFSAATGDPPLATIDAQTIERFLVACKRDALKPRSLRTYHAALSSFFAWAQQRGLVKTVATKDVTRIALPKTVPQGFSADELRRLLAACDARSPVGARDRALILVLYATGLRVGELCALTRTAYEQGRVLRVVGKGNKERLVALQADAAGAIEHYLLLRGSDDDPALWLGHRGPMTTSGVWQALRTVGERAGVEHVHPHRFRHTALAAMLQAGLGEVAVMQIAGHASVTQLSHYVQWAQAIRANDALIAADYVRETLGRATQKSHQTR